VQEYIQESLLRLARAAGWVGQEVLQVMQRLEAESNQRDGKRVNATPRPVLPLPPEIRQTIERHNRLDMLL